MRQKELRFVVTFHTTAEAMAMEGLCKKAGVPGKLISAPRSVSADCGIAWSSPAAEEDAVRRVTQEAALEIQGFHSLML